MSNIQIIEYNPTHAKALADMWNHSSWIGEKITETEQSVLVTEANSAHLNLYLAILDDLVVGYCKLSTFQKEGNTLYVHALIVRSDYHGKKVGKALILKCVERTIELGYPRLDLYTWAGNTKAIPLYKKCGFFWEDNDDDVHLFNFIPEVLTIESFTDFFKKADWYNHSTRAIDILYDGKKVNGFEICRYEWECADQKLIVDYTIKGRGIKRVETADYTIDTHIENANLPFGKSFECVYEITNKSGKELIVEITGKDDKSIKYNFHQELKVEQKELVKSEFYLDSIENEYGIWKTHPAVTAEIRVNGKAIPFKTGVSPKFPLQIVLELDDDREHFRDRKSVFFLNLKNNYPGRVNYKFSLKSTENIQMLNPLVDVILDQDQKTVISKEYIARAAEYYIDNLLIEAIPEDGTAFLFHKELRNSFFTENGVFFGESSAVCRGGNNAIALYYDKENSEMQCYEVTNYHYGYISYIRPTIGLPFSQEFDNKQASKIEHRIENGVLFLAIHYHSDDFPGIEVVDNFCLNSDRSVERFYQVINHSEVAQKIVLKDQYDFQPIGQCLSYKNRVLRKLSSSLKDENITENWLFSGSEHDNSYVSFCWGKQVKPLFKDNELFFEIDLGVLQPNESKTSEAITSCIAKHRKFEQLRKYAAEKYGLKYDPSFKEDDFYELDINNGNPFAQTLKAGVKNCSDQPLEGEFTLFCNGELLSELTINVDDNQAAGLFEVSAELTEEITLLNASFSLPEMEISDSKTVFRVGQNIVKTVFTEMDGQQILEADNGLIRIKTAPDFAPDIFSLEYKGKEWLHSSFPEPRANARWNPWLGGIINYCPSVAETDKLLKEKSSAEFVSIKDSLNNLWHGIMITTKMLENKNSQGMVQTQYFLMLPNSPVLVSFLKVENHSNQHKDLRSYNDTFVNYNQDSRIGIKNVQGKNILVKAGGQDELFFLDQAVFKIKECKEKLIIFNTNRQLNNRCAGLDGAFYTQIRNYTSIRNNETLVLPPVFYILSDKDFQNSELKDLFNVRFEVLLRK